MSTCRQLRPDVHDGAQMQISAEEPACAKIDKRHFDSQRPVALPSTDQPRMND